MDEKEEFDINIMTQKFVDAEETLKRLEKNGLKFKNRDEERRTIAISFYIETMRRMAEKKREDKRQSRNY